MSCGQYDCGFWDQIVHPIFGRPMYFDRRGEVITPMQRAELAYEVDDSGDVVSTAYRQIGYDVVDDATVSTVWIGIDMRFGGEGPPIIFETMVFGGKFDSFQMRYATEEEAIKGHREAVDDVRVGMHPWWSYGGRGDDEWNSAGS